MTLTAGRVVLLVLVCTLAGCHYYEEFRVLQGTADIKSEQAEIMRAYRLCLQKYEADPPGAKEHCAPYTQSLREIEIRSQR
ncbi:MAG: hypothetical protein E8D45_08305 [Nitrospira sp.]|nr:MAG: hypothetical protein E8D45_08305 [Nitrospira sp.]